MGINIEKIQEQLEGKSPPRLESRLTSIEKQLESTQDSLEWIKSALQKSIKDNKPKESAPEVLLTKQIRVEGAQDILAPTNFIQ
ncbi:hypothetical protein MAR_020413 [Mya arenaria]|uniref:Uncharacterized protein n=1 Tax=Mya arenaria TaxID=6604 RepID=A0ABY7E9G8_MYAAR|nr:hypothetical protein MAR_020413 [Mya arenaria]